MAADDGSYFHERCPLDYIIVGPNSVKSPGVIPPGGIDGFDREYGWDVKEGKGQAGATLTRKGQPLAEGTITFQMGTQGQLDAWNTFSALLKGSYKSTKVQDQAIVIYHPLLAQLGLTQFVAKSISPALHVGRGLFEAKVALLEFRPPPPVSIANTPTSTTGGKSSTAPGAQPDPVADAQQKQIQLLLTQAAAL